MMIMTIRDIGLLFALLSCATRIPSTINAAATSVASHGARIQRTSTSTRFSPQPHTQTHPISSSSRRRLWGAVLIIRGGETGGVQASNVNATVHQTLGETAAKEKAKATPQTLRGKENDVNTTATETETTATTELAYSLTGQDKVVIPAKTQDKAANKEAPVAATRVDLPPAIVETTTTTVIDQSDFSQIANETLKASDHSSHVVGGDNVVDSEDMHGDDSKELQEEEKDEDGKKSSKPTETMLDAHIEDLENIILKDKKVSDTPTAPPTKPTLSVHETRERAAELRLEGKELHDAGDYVEAADCFGAAADLMHPYFVNHGHGNKDELDENDLFDLSENFCTLRLHEALCRLKALDYEAAESACSQVLEGGNSNNKDDNKNIHLSSAVRARALFRRAKARIEMDMVNEAMQDARIAAFLGDRKAVALYGQLMREMSTSSSSSTTTTADNGSGSSLASSASLLASLLDKSGAGDGSSPGGFSPFGDLPLSSSGNGAGMDFNPLSLLSMLQPQPGAAGGLSGGGPMGGGGAGSLAKSVLTSLSKRLDDENTQETICNFLQQASGPQLQQYAIMAGVQLPASQANKIASFCQGITPRGLRRTVQNSKRVLYCIQLIRKTMAVLNKYKMIIFLIVLITWIKSAILRPIPINKRLARQAARQAAMAATAAI